MRRVLRYQPHTAALLVIVLLTSACLPEPAQIPAGQLEAIEETLAAETEPTETLVIPPPFPTRPLYAPGELVDYTAQAGDTLPVLAVRFNTTVEEIREANPHIPITATTMPPGMPMKIPIYYQPLWGSSYQILPDSLFVNGPAQVGFDIQAYVDAQPGWLKNFYSFASGKNRSGAELVQLIATNYSVSPRLLLALLEYQSKALSDPTPPEELDFPLGYRSWQYKGLYMQLGWASNTLNNGYYQARTGKLTAVTLRDGRMERLDPWLNAATSSLHYYFSQILSPDEYALAISPKGLAQTYAELFGDPWENEQPHIPGSLLQPEFILPFETGSVWAFTGGPHTAWGRGDPRAALDFAPPLIASGCQETSQWATAVADGVVARSEEGTVVLDLDGDGDERTGWNVFYLHVATEGRARLGTSLKQGDPVGHPSCEGGSSTGTHVHIARKYNGEWIPAEGIQGILAFNLEGWIAYAGQSEYVGTLQRFSQVVTACECSNQASFIKSDRQ